MKIKITLFCTLSAVILFGCEKEGSLETGNTPTPVIDSTVSGRLRYTFDTIAGIGIGGTEYYYDAAGRYTRLKTQKIASSSGLERYDFTFTRNASGQIVRVFALDSFYTSSVPSVLQVDTTSYYPHYTAGKIDWYRSDTTVYYDPGISQSTYYDSVVVLRNAAGQPSQVRFYSIYNYYIYATGASGGSTDYLGEQTFAYNPAGNLLRYEDSIYVNVVYSYDAKKSPNQVIEEAVFMPELMYNISPNNVAGFVSTEPGFPLDEVISGSFNYSYSPNNYPLSFTGMVRTASSTGAVDSASWKRRYVYY
jgi:hypothetical protein